MSARKIGNYVVEEALGAGSFATVWQAFDPVLDARVAIKVLAENWAQHEDVRRRFIEEARILRRIDDDAIVRVHLIDELDDGRPYFVMSLADNGSLTERLRDGALGVEQARSIALSVLECLSVVHDFGVVHRDIKPSNVFFRTVRPHQRAAAERAGQKLGTERVVLGDFGLAKDTVAASGFTLAAGTPAYMAPEQARSSAMLDPRADLYSVGVILYEMLAGQPPFNVTTLSDVRSGRDQHDAVPLAVAAPLLPRELVVLVERAMALDPAQRFETAAEMATALRAIDLGEVVVAEPPSRQRSGLEGRVVGHFRRLHEIDVGAEHQATLDSVRAMVFEPRIRVASAVGLPTGLDSDRAVFVDDAATADLVIGGAEAGLIWLPEPAADPQIAELLARRLPEFAAARAIGTIGSVMSRSAGTSRDARKQLRAVIDGLREDVPGVVAIEMAIASLAHVLPGDLGVQARQILLWDQAARQLGLVADAEPAEIESALLATLDTWRTLVNAGRVPFSALTVAEAVISQLERLWLDVVDSSS